MNYWPSTRTDPLVDRRKRVFVVEDSPLIRERLVGAIEAMPCCTVVGTAEAEQEAIAGIVDSVPDLVIADIQLREGSGLKVLRDIRSRTAARPTVVMLTNHASKEYYDESIASGADAVFDKTRQLSAFLTFLENIH